MKFVITYDVCEPGRLRRVARRLEQSAVRVQKSVFIFEGSRRDLDGIAADLMCLVDIAEDRVQAWPVHDGPGIRGWEAGTALPGAVAAVILSPEGLVYVEMPQ